MPPLLNKKQAAECLGIGLSTLDRWIADREIPYIQLGPRRIAFKQADIEAYLEKQTVPARKQRNR